MLLFWSEEHIDRWCKQWNKPHGGTMSIEACARLAYEWYGDRLDPEGRRKTPEEARAIFESLDLIGDFWSLG
jgi:hypothetical protein